MIDYYDITIDAHTPLPKYEQLKQALKAQIVQLPDEIEYLPYEYDLAGKIGVSRQTVSRAYAELRKDGIIETVKNRGSKIINRDFTRRRVTVQEEVAPTCGTIASIFCGDSDEPVRTGYLPWRVTDVLEKHIAPLGGTVAVYNTRNPEWQDVDRVLASMRESKIHWVFAHPTRKTMELLPGMIAAGIRLAVLCDALTTYEKLFSVIGPGIDTIQLNNPYALRKTVADEFADADGIFYLTTDHDLSWSAERITALQEYARARDLSFETMIEHVENPLETGENSHFGKWRQAGLNGASRLMKTICRHQRPLCVACNDRLAVGVVEELVSRGVKVPQQVRVLGYDNLSEMRSHNLSTFDFNAEAIGDALFKLYLDYCKAPEATPVTSQSITVFPKFIRRLTS